MHPEDLSVFWMDISHFAESRCVDARQVVVHESDLRISRFVHAKIYISLPLATHIGAWLDGSIFPRQGLVTEDVPPTQTI